MGRIMVPWNNDQVMESLNAQAMAAVSDAQVMVNWYANRAWRKGITSRILRLGALVTGGAGAFWPTITSVIKCLSDYGYISFACLTVAAGLLAMDYYLGISTGWIRYMVAKLEIQRLIHEFELDWTLAVSRIEGSSPSQAQISECLQKTKVFVMKTHDIVKRETDTWVAEFQSSMAELEKTVRAQIDTKKPGSVGVTILNYADFDEVTLYMEGQGETKMNGASALLSSIPPGNYELRIASRKGSQGFNDSCIVEIRPGAMANVDITLQPKTVLKPPAKPTTRKPSPKKPAAKKPSPKKPTTRRP